MTKAIFAIRRTGKWPHMLHAVLEVPHVPHDSNCRTDAFCSTSCPALVSPAFCCIFAVDIYFIVDNHFVVISSIVDSKPTNKDRIKAIHYSEDTSASMVSLSSLVEQET